jgi:hypothetical protein
VSRFASIDGDNIEVLISAARSMLPSKGAKWYACDVLVKDLCDALEQEAAGRKYLEEKLNEAVDYLRQGKVQFTPNTTNSLVDGFLDWHKSFNQPKDADATGK